MPSLDFRESCCDGGQCADNDKSAQPCGCDKGANWTCEQHRGPMLSKREELEMLSEQKPLKPRIGRDDTNPKKWFDCEHANENPRVCPCPITCICRDRGQMCVGKAYLNPSAKAPRVGDGGERLPTTSPAVKSFLEAPRGLGGAPTRATTLPDDPRERKKYPINAGVLEYFPDAIAAIARVSYEGNEQHHPGQPLHWDRSKSPDEAEAMMRHWMQRGSMDKDGVSHTAKAAWRMLAYLQKELEAGRGTERG